MTKNIINFNEDTKKTLDLIKIKHGLKRRGDSIDFLCKKYGKGMRGFLK